MLPEAGEGRPAPTQAWAPQLQAGPQWKPNGIRSATRLHRTGGWSYQEGLQRRQSASPRGLLSLWSWWGELGGLWC